MNSERCLDSPGVVSDEFFPNDSYAFVPCEDFSNLFEKENGEGLTS